MFALRPPTGLALLRHLNDGAECGECRRGPQCRRRAARISGTRPHVRVHGRVLRRHVHPNSGSTCERLSRGMLPGRNAPDVLRHAMWCDLP